MLVSTMNPAIDADGSNAEQAPCPKINPHICSCPYIVVSDLDQDFKTLLLHVSATLGAPVPIIFAKKNEMATKNVDLNTHWLCSMKQTS